MIIRYHRADGAGWTEADALGGKGLRSEDLTAGQNAPDSVKNTCRGGVA